MCIAFVLDFNLSVSVFLCFLSEPSLFTHMKMEVEEGSDQKSDI